jgi:hypothetical protein
MFEMHEIPLRLAPSESVGFGVDLIDHFVPFQVSASVMETPAPFTYSPPAVHAVAEVQETVNIELPLVPTGFGVASIDQSVPFQASARVLWPLTLPMPT